jgi:ferredoxin
VVFYFSGTGNSRYAAQLTGNKSGDRIVSINAVIKAGSRECYHSEKPLVFVCPVYAWKIPRIVDQFIRESTFTGNRNAYFILTCGDSAGGAWYFARKTCMDKGLNFLGAKSVVMPENYIAMFKVPDREKADAIIKKAVPDILLAAEHIKNEKPLPCKKSAFAGRLISSLINPFFYRWIISAKGFHYTEACIGCGKCAELCTLSNVTLKNGRPEWGSNCTHCMACICGCPARAVEYKTKTIGKPRYFNTREAN